jgi:hypothetical protein
MPIETNCPGCNRVLRVGDEYAGRQARCPICSTIYIVPDDSAVPQQQPPPAPEPRWYMKTPERQVYGPISWSELQRWLSEGRISAECELRSDDQTDWRPAGEYFGGLSAGRTVPPSRPFAAATAPQSANPFADRDATAGWPGGANSAGRGWAAASQSYQTPHRGVLVLILGIFGWSFSCPILGVVAWVMGNSDLREMDCGRMDRSGRGLTQAGRVLGMVQTLLWLVMFLIAMFVGLLSAVA